MTVGKKKKRVVVYRSGKKKSLLFPMLVIGGVVIWMLYKKNASAAAATDTTIPPDNTGSLSDPGTLDTTVTVTPPVTPAPAPAPPVADSPFDIAPEMRNYTKTDFYNYMNDPIRRAHGYKNLDISWHTLTSLQIMYALSKYIPFTNSSYWVAFDSMTEPELINTWVYVNLYLSKNKILLYSADPVLYNAIATLKSRFGIF